MTGAMDSEELRRLGLAAFGHGWQTALSRERGVAERTVRYWVSKGIDKVDTADAIRNFLLSRRVIHVPAAPPGLDRAEAATRLVDAILEIVLDGAQATGWDEREMTVAFYSVLIERMTERLGAAATRGVLSETLSQVERGS